MARPGEDATSLIEEDGRMADAVQTVLETADENGVVQWSDVSNDLTSGQWGRLVDTSILIDGGGGFVVDDPDTVREALEEASPGSFSSDDDSGWSIYDKGAAGGSLVLFLGYTQQPLRATIGGVLEVVLGPIVAALPFYVVILLLALFTGITSTIIQSELMNMEKMGEYQQRMKAIQEKRKRAKEQGDDAALEEAKSEQRDAMGDQLGMFKAQFRPMAWIMLVNIPLFLWLYWKTLDVGVGPDGVVFVMPLGGEVASWNSRIGPTWAWLVWYFVASFSLSQIVRKALDIRTTPDTG
jgi:uncharacterized membrane protein (DUF106 family)